MKLSFKKLFVAISLLASATFAMAQQQLPELVDTLVRRGVLSNGMTYYIRHNEYPKGQADFHIAQKVGAVQENEDQNGLAHFLEHMCFNGTKHFPDKQLLTWLETKGVKFGLNINAHTGTDQTVYDIMNVPTANKEVVDSCLLILHDWANDLTLADEEIEKERGVIHEEWRMGNGAVARILDRYASVLYPGTKYATHNVIGKMEIIDNFKPQVLRDYYEKWYRPDLQAIVVVGDIDVDIVEKQIKKIFSPIEMPENPAAFGYEFVADNVEPIVISDKDAEMPANLLLVAQKYDFLPREYRNTVLGLQVEFFNAVFSSMLNQRFTELTLSNDAPFANCGGALGSFLYANTKGALTCQAIVNEKGSDVALHAVLRELKRIRLYGFTAAEYDRARAEYLSNLERLYKNFSTSKNNYFTQLYIQNFLESAPVTAVDYEYETMKDVLPMIGVELLNQYVAQIVTDKNLVVMSLCPDKEGVVMPSVDELKEVIAEVEAENVEPYVDAAVTEPLMSELPVPGKITKTTENKQLGYTELMLSNGAKVILKKTAFKENEILLEATSKGGASLYDAADFPNANFGSDVLNTTGLGKFTYTDMQKLLSGKQVSLSAEIERYGESVSGSSSVSDLETMMQLLYLQFTQPREDQAAFENVKKLILSQLENVAHDPQFVFQDSLTRKLHAHHPKAVTESKEVFNKVDYARSLQIYKERFADASDFTFYIVGNFDMDTMKNYVCQYIASLPAKGVKEVAKNDGLDFAKGKVDETFVLPNESKLAMLAMVWSLDLPYTLENKIKINVAGQLMATELLNSVREDEGAAYSPYAVGGVDRGYKDSGVIQTAFGLNPAKAERSTQVTIECLEKLAKDVKESELAKIKEYLLKNYKVNVEENKYWLGRLEDYVEDGIDTHTDYEKAVETLTVKGMEEFISQIVNANRFKLLMMPE